MSEEGNASSQSSGVVIHDNASRISSVAVSHDAAPLAVRTSTGILSTARSQNDRGLDTRGVRGDDLVRIGRVELTAEQAAKEGYLVRDGDHYRDVTPEDRAANAKANDAFEEANPDEFDDQRVQVNDVAMSIISDMSAAVEEQGTAMSQVVAQFIADPNVLPAGLARASIARGENLAEVLQQSQGLMRGYEQMITAEVSKRVDLPADRMADFYLWARGDGQKANLTRAALEVLSNGSIAGFVSMAKTYITNSAAGKDAARPRAVPAGVKTFIHPQTKQRMVTLRDGLTTTEANARRLGLLKAG